MAKPRNSKAEILAAIKKTARRLKRAPTKKEFGRLSGMTASQVMVAFGSYQAGLRAAGVRKLGPSGRIGTTELLEDWGRVVRKVGRHPSVNEYRVLGTYSEVSLISRVGRWCNVREMFLEFVRSNGLEHDWADVVKRLQTGPWPGPGSANGWLSRTESLVGTSKPGPASRQMKQSKKVLQEKPKSSGWPRMNSNKKQIEEGLRGEQRVEQAFRPAVSPQRIGLQPLRFGNSLGISAPTPGMGIDEVKPEFVLPELRGMRCVTRTMLWVLCGANRSQATCVSQEGEAEESKNLSPVHADEGRVDQPTAGTVPPETAIPAPLPLELHGKRCVTQSMLWILFADEKPSMLDLSGQNALPRIYDVAGQNPLPQIYSDNRGPGSLALNLRFPRRAIAGRPMMGPPLTLNGRIPHGLVREPVNEAGVVFLFGMVAHLLGFDVEALQGAFPDGEGKLEVEPGRWQNIRFEFEYESRKFPQHRHDPGKCDVIVCWKHNWKGCPDEIQVVELRKILKSP